MLSLDRLSRACGGSHARGQKRIRIVLIIEVWSNTVCETVRGSIHGETTIAGTRTP